MIWKCCKHFLLATVFATLEHVAHRDVSQNEGNCCLDLFFAFVCFLSCSFISKKATRYAALTGERGFVLHVTAVESYCCFVMYCHREGQLLAPVKLGAGLVGPDERSFLQRCSPPVGGRPAELCHRR